MPFLSKATEKYRALLVSARKRWNEQADVYNQWDVLGQDEKDDLVRKEIERE